MSLFLFIYIYGLLMFVSDSLSFIISYYSFHSCYCRNIKICCVCQEHFTLIPSAGLSSQATFVGFSFYFLSFRISKSILLCVCVFLPLCVSLSDSSCCWISADKLASSAPQQCVYAQPGLIRICVCVLKK